MKRTFTLLAISVLTAASATFILASPAAAATCNSSVYKDTFTPYPGWPGHYMLAEVPTYGGSTNCAMGRGANSHAVVVLQNTLNDCFGLSEKLEEDGVFGGRTEAMLKEAQRLTGATVDGVYGPNTRDRFNINYRWAAYTSASPPTKVCGRVQQM